MKKLSYLLFAAIFMIGCTSKGSKGLEAENTSEDPTELIKERVASFISDSLSESQTMQILNLEYAAEYGDSTTVIYSRRTIDEGRMRRAISQGDNIDPRDFAPSVSIGDPEKALEKADGNPIIGAIVSYAITEGEKTDTLYSYFFFKTDGECLERGMSKAVFEEPRPEIKPTPETGDYMSFRMGVEGNPAPR